MFDVFGVPWEWTKITGDRNAWPGQNVWPLIKVDVAMVHTYTSCATIVDMRKNGLVTHTQNTMIWRSSWVNNREHSLHAQARRTARCIGGDVFFLFLQRLAHGTIKLARSEIAAPTHTQSNPTHPETSHLASNTLCDMDTT